MLSGSGYAHFAKKKSFFCFVCVPQSTQRQLVKVALSGWGFFVHKLNKLAIYVLHKMCNAKYVVAKKPNLPSPYTVTIPSESDPEVGETFERYYTADVSIHIYICIHISEEDR